MHKATRRIADAAARRTSFSFSGRKVIFYFFDRTFAFDCNRETGPGSQRLYSHNFPFAYQFDGVPESRPEDVHRQAHGCAQRKLVIRGHQQSAHAYVVADSLQFTEYSDRRVAQEDRKMQLEPAILSLFWIGPVTALRLVHPTILTTYKLARIER